jgi:hypothetical protein
MDCDVMLLLLMGFFDLDDLADDDVGRWFVEHGYIDLNNVCFLDIVYE